MNIDQFNNAATSLAVSRLIERIQKLEERVSKGLDEFEYKLDEISGRAYVIEHKLGLVSQSLDFTKNVLGSKILKQLDENEDTGRDSDKIVSVEHTVDENGDPVEIRMYASGNVERYITARQKPLRERP